jgi:hypothetical protein
MMRGEQEVGDDDAEIEQWLMRTHDPTKRILQWRVTMRRRVGSGGALEGQGWSPD